MFAVAVDAERIFREVLGLGDLANIDREIPLRTGRTDYRWRVSMRKVIAETSAFSGTALRARR